MHDTDTQCVWEKPKATPTIKDSQHQQHLIRQYLQDTKAILLLIQQHR